MPQSPELASGAGFTFEDHVSAVYLTALLGERYAPGTGDNVVSRVALQQRDFGEPLDDIIVDFGSAGEQAGRLSLQVKRKLVVSSATTNKDFKDVVRDSWLTFQKPNFRAGIDRYGVAVGTIAKNTARDLATLCELARASEATSHFEARFAKTGNASDAVRRIRKDIEKLLEQAVGTPCPVDGLHGFLAHFVLLEFDFLHAGSVSRPELLNQVQDALADDQASQAPSVWSRLCQLARESGGRAGEFSRGRLVRELSPTVRLRVAPSFRGDVERLTALAGDWVVDIENDVGGTQLERKHLVDDLDRRLKKARFVQIRGLPGSGKSVLLRQRIEADLDRGPVLFLKHDRLEGRSWPSFAAAMGLSAAPLSDLLAEISAAGSATLYIDGIDRVESEHQAIVLDVVRSIVRSPECANWRIAMTLRDSGIEPLRNWMGELLEGAGIETVNVGLLNEDEAEFLATQKPHLRPLLFGSISVQDIVRRPFFAKVLGRTAATEGPPFHPKSEIDLLANWWARGGYDASGRAAVERQRAIIDLARARALNLSRPIALRDLASTTVGLISDLAVDGILQHVRVGISVRFSHDIFFEWSFFHALSDVADGWPEEIRRCGEPPAVARVVELLSQFEYFNGNGWETTLAQLDASSMRSQWMRAWLLGPIAVSAFSDAQEAFEKAASAEDYRLLKKALVWFQAERTTPNTNILARDLPPDQRIRFADLLGWPADFGMWRRFIEFLLARVAAIPVRLYPDVVSIFDVWQNALQSYPNATSSQLLEQASDWLGELHSSRSRRSSEDPQSKWDGLGDRSTFATSLVHLIFRATDTKPKLAGKYLASVIADEDDVRRETFKEIADFSPNLSRSHPGELVELTLKHLKEKLPAEKVAREREEAEHAAELRRAALAKPESKRTRQDKMAASGAFMRLGSLFSHHDWSSLALERDYGSFTPSSPLREPFRSLFANAPAEALRLLSELSNHAMEAWRQLHVYHYEKRGTPIPLEISFPWGKQIFWGTDREYLWHRGMWAPGSLACGYMALEEWCFAELGKGRDANELIKQIVEGNQCIAILGAAVAIALHSETISETVFALLASQRLWAADHNRMRHDLTSSSANVIGFMSRDDAPHVTAIKAANVRPVRHRELRYLAPRYIWMGGEFSERLSSAVIRFKDDLPYEYEEHRSLEEARDHLTQQAEEFTEVAAKENYQAYKTAEDSDQIAIVHVSPSAATPEAVQRVENARASLREFSLQAWAAKVSESGEFGEQFTIASALALARELDTDTLFEAPRHESDLGTRTSAVAGAATVLLQYPDGASPSDLDWARNILGRAAGAPERFDVFWSSGSIVPWHHAVLAARGLAADIRSGTASPQAAQILLRLVAHPLEAVSLTALEEAQKLWAKDPRLSWSAIRLAIRLSRVDPTPPEQPRGPSQPTHPVTVSNQAAVDELQNYLSGTGWLDLPVPPPAWVKLKQRRARRLPWDSDGDEGGSAGGEETWGIPEIDWHSQYASQILERIPYETVLKSEAGTKLRAFMASVLSWTIEKIAPPWAEKGRRDRGSSSLYEWTHELGRALAKIAGNLPIDQVKSDYLKPICDLEGEQSWELLSPFIDFYIRAHVLDRATIHPDAVEVLDVAVTRVLQDRTFDRKGYRAGEMSGHDLAPLVKALLFVTIEEARGAARFVNGDWSEVGLIVPIVDRIVRGAGWAPSVMGYFLTLCERARASYPAETLADQILAILDGDSGQRLKGWHGTTLPARIAGLVQHHANRDGRMPSSLAQKLLRILDLLVDLGDRRSAALQLSEAFREVQTAA